MQANLYAPATIWDLGFREITSSVKPISRRSTTSPA